MHKHNGIVVVAWLPGQPLSQIEADLQMHGLDEAFTTHVQHQVDGQDAKAANLNLYDEALDLVMDLQDAGFNSCVCETHTEHGWVIA